MHIHTSGTIINGRYQVVQGPKEKPSLMGGMGAVYLCVDHGEDGLPVALKTFQPQFLSDRRARDLFLKEGNTWKKVYWGGGAHFKNWLEQAQELAETMGSEIEVEEIEVQGLRCYEESGEKMYRIWLKEVKHAD